MERANCRRKGHAPLFSWLVAPVNIIPTMVGHSGGGSSSHRGSWILMDPVCSFSNTCKATLIMLLCETQCLLLEIWAPGALAPPSKLRDTSTNWSAPLSQSFGSQVWISFFSEQLRNTSISGSISCPLVSEETCLPLLENFGMKCLMK